MSIATIEQTDVHDMHCMEIWGGMSAANDAISTPGLNVQIFAEPFEGSHEGGDVHYLSSCGAGKISRFLLADVAGHGDAVAEVAGNLRKLLRRNINNPDTTKLARSLNDEFAELANNGRFATAILTTYFAPTNQLVVVNAGHPRPMWHRARTGIWEILDHQAAPTDAGGPANLPLGVLSGTDYEQFAVNMEPDDIVLLFTDSLTEAKDSAGNMLGQDGLLELTREVPIEDGSVGFCERLLDKVAAYRGGTPADDDVTLVGLRHDGSGPRDIALGERVAVLAKMIGILPV